MEVYAEKVVHEPMQVPVTGTAADVERIFGIRKTPLLKLVADGRVRKIKLNPASPKSASIYRMADIMEVVEGVV